MANLPPVSLIPGANLPPVSTTLAKLVANFAAVVVDTGGKFATSGKFAAGVVDNGENFATVSLIPVANLPPVSTTLAKLLTMPVSLTPVVHLHLQISPQIFEKI